MQNTFAFPTSRNNMEPTPSANKRAQSPGSGFKGEWLYGPVRPVRMIMQTSSMRTAIQHSHDEGYCAHSHRDDWRQKDGWHKEHRTQYTAAAHDGLRVQSHRGNAS